MASTSPSAIKDLADMSDERLLPDVSEGVEHLVANFTRLHDAASSLGGGAGAGRGAAVGIPSEPAGAGRAAGSGMADVLTKKRPSVLRVEDRVG